MIQSKLTVNQIEINPFLYRKKTISYFKKEGMVLLEIIAEKFISSEEKLLARVISVFLDFDDV